MEPERTNHSVRFRTETKLFDRRILLFHSFHRSSLSQTTMGTSTNDNKRVFLFSYILNTFSILLAAGIIAASAFDLATQLATSQKTWENDLEIGKKVLHSLVNIKCTIIHHALDSYCT
jgi:hypothetical protein